MDTKIKLLKNLGFSEDFINAIEEGSYENNLVKSAPTFSCFESLNIQGSDFTSLIIEKSDEPLNVDAVFSLIS